MPCQERWPHKTGLPTTFDSIHLSFASAPPENKFLLERLDMIVLSQNGLGNLVYACPRMTLRCISGRSRRTLEPVSICLIAYDWSRGLASHQRMMTISKGHADRHELHARHYLTSVHLWRMALGVRVALRGAHSLAELHDHSTHGNAWGWQASRTRWCEISLRGRIRYSCTLQGPAVRQSAG
jgi:hypothetical protein